ncbi:hypothetical protein D3C87_1647910 [compost metagenome]
MTGVKAKLYCGGGDEVAHSSVRPSQGSPVVSHSLFFPRIETANWISMAAMPPAITSAPMPAMMNQICSDGSSNVRRRRVMPISPST